MCKKCFIEHKNNEAHECMSYKCFKCSVSFKNSPHHCFMKTLDIEKLKEEDKKTKLYALLTLKVH